MKKMLFMVVLCFLGIGLNTQSIVLISGSIDFLQGEKNVKFGFSYDNMLAGKMRTGIPKKNITGDVETTPIN